jgi:hypothetical protein
VTPTPSQAHRATALTATEVHDIVDRCCTSKQRYATPGEARRAALAARARRRKPLNSYRCPFTDGTRAGAHWHIGRTPSLTSLERIAQAIRARAQGAA